MAEYNDLNRGVLFINDRREKESQPHRKGSINVDGIWYWVAAWDESSKGTNYQSLALTVMTQDEVDKKLAKRAARKPPQAPQQQNRREQPTSREVPQTPPENHPVNEPSGELANFDDDIPF